MLRHPWTGLALVALLMASALATCLFSARWFFAVGELQRTQARSETLTRTSGLMQQLAADAIEYGRRDSSIQPVLSQLNLKATGLGSTPHAATNVPTSRSPVAGESPR